MQVSFLKEETSQNHRNYEVMHSTRANPEPLEHGRYRRDGNPAKAI
jgi:hypothetical protein